MKKIKRINVGEVLEKVHKFCVLYIFKFISIILFIKLPPILSVGAFIKRDNKYLFVDLSYINGFGLPGGIIENLESVEHALKREIKEETGFNIINSKYLYSVVSKYRGVDTLSLIFSIEVSGDLKESGEGKLVWTSLEYFLKRPAYENGRLAVEKLINSKN